jgi:hypothetical protein
VILPNKGKKATAALGFADKGGETGDFTELLYAVYCAEIICPVFTV